MSDEKKIIDQQQVGQLTWSADGRTSAQVRSLIAEIERLQAEVKKWVEVDDGRQSN